MAPRLKREAAAAAEEEEEAEQEEKEEGEHLKAAASSTIDRRLSRSGGPGRDTTPSRAISPNQRGCKEAPKSALCGAHTALLTPIGAAIDPAATKYCD